MADSGFHVYLWRLLIFWRTLYKADISIKRTFLSCTNGVNFIEIPLWLLKRHVEFKQTLVLIINFFFLNFTIIEIEWVMVNSSQNKHTLGGRGRGCSKMNKGKQGGRVVKTRESWANVLFERPLSSFSPSAHEINFQKKLFEANLPFTLPNFIISWARNVSINTNNW